MPGAAAMGVKRKSGGNASGSDGKSAKKMELAAVPAADLKKQEHLKLFDEWLKLNSMLVVIFSTIL